MQSEKVLAINRRLFPLYIKNVKWAGTVGKVGERMLVMQSIQVIIMVI